MGGVRRQGKPKEVFKHIGEVLPQKRRAFAKVLRSIKVHFGRIYKAAIEQIRWLRKEDWDLVGVEATDERRFFPPQWSPYFVEEWKCKQTGKTRIVLVR
jgi:hypothetical protein